ncbi:MAG TPA: PrsW family glutamic-type intramembrane protease [Candidatus Paceibacterota bacterium]|nr:PrsW family glutamic-type intramembrane protease [Candidatus Paceibacterota bacterium]
MTSDPKILALAFVAGIIPSLLWLWFWLKEDKKNPEPKGLLAAVFIMGIIAVIFVLPIQKFIQAQIVSPVSRIVLWASAEEIMKYLAVLVVLYKTNQIDEPLDWPIYLITAALGFAALENALFLIKPLTTLTTTVSFLTGELRFLGSTLLHTVSSGILGIGLGISFHMRKFMRKLYLVVGLLLAIALHSVFNFFIIEVNGSGFLGVLRVFAFLWVVTIIVMLLFEKVRRMS